MDGCNQSSRDEKQIAYKMRVVDVPDIQTAL